ncbi:MAG: tetraacyldisaccharide 4'-kinase [Lentimicrobium sp.]|nr:tetraacyldisaccharide 4'-kinase [Lentimicrobium sp.]
MEILRTLLIPFAALYGLLMAFRNLLFDLKILPSQEFPFPVISVGNLTVGGTGKTPHVEYLIRLLSSDYQVSTLSRGYSRKTKGFREASTKDNSSTIGDEPMQYFRKFKNIGVFVDEKRLHGIQEIIRLKQDEPIILLDDAFQHRYVKSGLSILLTDYHRLYTRDFILPAGKLRESKKGASRADIIIVTKTPSVLSPILKRQLIEEIKPKPHQKICFSFIKYGALTSLWNEESIDLKDKHYGNILLFAGIANTYPIEDHLRKRCLEMSVLKFPDHHNYTVADLRRIEGNFNDLYSPNKLLVTTEKDAMRMLKPELAEIAKNLPVYFLPIEIEIHKEDKQQFDDQILNYVRKN